MHTNMLHKHVPNVLSNQNLQLGDHETIPLSLVFYKEFPSVSVLSIKGELGGVYINTGIKVNNC